MLAHLAKLCLLSLILSRALAGQEAQSKKPENPPSKENCSIAGLVVKLGSSEPLKKVEVYLQKVDDPESGYSAQHSGTMTRGAPQMSVTVVRDSGTGQLAGFAGKMTIEITDGKHSYEFDYTLPRTP